jgi:phosphopantetheinyl transferase
VRERGLARLRHHALTDWERGELERQAAHRETEVFLSYWTRKEALLKAAGFGLAIDPKLIELPPRRTSLHPVRVPDSLGRAEQWSIVELDVDGCVAAVAADAPAPRVRVIPLELDSGPGVAPKRPLPNADLP